MGEPRHTPGPWIIGQAGDEMCPRLGIGPVPGLEYVAITFNGNDEANARLIAAAPDLLAALTRLANLVDDTRWGSRWPGRPHAEMDAARVAIAKAEGEGTSNA